MSQLPTATILGAVKDSTGAVVPGAGITAKNLETGLTRTGASAEHGSYRFSALPVGVYEVRVDLPGFRTEVRSGLNLAVSQEAVVNFTLQLGALQETVVVTEEAPLVNTTSGTLGGLVDERKVAELPLNGRNFIDLTLLQPGVTQHRNLAVAASTVGLWFAMGRPCAPTIINHPNFALSDTFRQVFAGSANGEAPLATAGVITTTGSVRSRQIQFALKLLF